jgi:hypothetical protein
MRKLLKIIAIVGVAVLIPTSVPAQELLTNPGLELVPPDGGGRDSVASGWTTVEGPHVPSNPNHLGNYNDSGFIDAADYVVWRKGGPLANEGANPIGVVNGADYDLWVRRFGEPVPMSLSEPSNFNHILETFPPNPPAPDPGGSWQHWFQGYNGTFAEQEDNFAHLYQDVPGTPGLQYTMTGWAMGEEVFPGGVTNLNAGTAQAPTGAPFDDGPLSPTNVYFALEFLNSSGIVLPGSVEKELKDDLGFENTNPDLGYLWQQFMLTAVAPPETVNVRVRATMTDGVLNPTPNPQSFRMSFFVDAFSLTASSPGSSAGIVPEPAGLAIAAVGLACVGASCRRFGLRRRKRLRPCRI